MALPLKFIRVCKVLNGMALPQHYILSASSATGGYAEQLYGQSVTPGIIFYKAAFSAAGGYAEQLYGQSVTPRFRFRFWRGGTPPPKV